MLTGSYKCENCNKENCGTLYFDKLRKQWNCKTCSTYLNDGDKVAKNIYEEKKKYK